MASRYLKIPVYQLVQVRNPEGLGEYGGQYSKILKTLRVPQEYLATTTGSPKWGLQNDSFSGSKLQQLSDVAGDNGYLNTILTAGGKEEPFPPSVWETQSGLWIELPLNTSRILWAQGVGPGADNPTNTALDFNKSLWLRVSQEVILEPVPGDAFVVGSRAAYIPPFFNSLYKNANTAYSMDVGLTPVSPLSAKGAGKEYYRAISNKDVHGVFNYLQEKIAKALSSNPGATETTLDFGSTDADPEAGLYFVENDGSTGDRYLPFPSAVADSVNKKCKILVTCAVVANRGQAIIDPGTGESQAQVLPALAETWGISRDFYMGAAGRGLEGDQTMGLNPAQLFTNTEDSTARGDFPSSNIENYVCEYFNTIPSKGKKKGGVPEGFEGVEEMA